jgi:hypothetical protein
MKLLELLQINDDVLVLIAISYLALFVPHEH